MSHPLNQPLHQPPGGPLDQRVGQGPGRPRSLVLEIGDELPPLRLPSITRTTLALFAGGSGDHNPVHIDSDAAHAAGMDDVFAHGMLGMAYLGRLLTSQIPQERIRALRVRFTAITPVHATPVCTGRVVAIEDRDGETCASVELSMRLSDGTTTLVGEASIAVDNRRKGEHPHGEAQW